MSDESLFKVPGLLQFIGLETLDKVQGFVGEAVDEGTDGDLKLGSGSGGPTSGGAARIPWQEEIREQINNVAASQ